MEAMTCSTQKGKWWETNSKNEWIVSHQLVNINLFLLFIMTLIVFPITFLFYITILLLFPIKTLFKENFDQDPKICILLNNFILIKISDYYLQWI